MVKGTWIPYSDTTTVSNGSFYYWECDCMPADYELVGFVQYYGQYEAPAPVTPRPRQTFGARRPTVRKSTGVPRDIWRPPRSGRAVA